ncbi:hypothetical protein [Xylella fastidiosa]|nr:hypothetical protein [Xylella fastidiosa]
MSSAGKVCRLHLRLLELRIGRRRQTLTIHELRHLAQYSIL